MDPYASKSRINMTDVVAVLSDLPQDYHQVKTIHSRYSQAAVQAGRTPAPIHVLDRLLAYMGCSARRGRGRWINVESLSPGWPREDWTPRGRVWAEEPPAQKPSRGGQEPEDEFLAADEFI